MQIYNKTHPFPAAIIERYNLCAPSSQKNIYHVVVDLAGSNYTYLVGDSLAVMGMNYPEVIENTLKALQATGDELIENRHTNGPTPLREFFLYKANLADVSKKLIQEICARQTNQQKKERLEFILLEEQKEALKEYQSAHEIWDALLENNEAQFTPQELCAYLMPLLPRFYSIASSMKEVGQQVHLTVAELVYETNGQVRRGVCTNFLCQLAPLNEKVMPVYVQPSNGFTVPEDNTLPMIMVGPGTGVAPYLGFMQERQARQATGLNWLFFGEWHRASEFLYADYWETFISKGSLRLSTAFSRDQEHKIYVQHRLLEHGQELFKLLEQGAYFYVCGDAKRMAKDVDLALHELIRMHGQLDEQGTKDYVKKLKQHKRYLRDVY